MKGKRARNQRKLLTPLVPGDQADPLEEALSAFLSKIQVGVLDRLVGETLKKAKEDGWYGKIGVGVPIPKKTEPVAGRPCSRRFNYHEGPHPALCPECGEPTSHHGGLI